jgi:hypothetical protein
MACNEFVPKRRRLATGNTDRNLCHRHFDPPPRSRMAATSQAKREMKQRYPLTLQTIIRDRRKVWQQVDRIALISLVVANIFPILLAIIFRWNVSGVVFLYWYENLVVGCYAILRIVWAGAGTHPAQEQRVKWFLVPFFTVHYFGFCAGHGFFLKLFFSDGLAGSFGSPRFAMSSGTTDGFGGLFSNFFELSAVAGWIAILGIVISHGISFVRNYLMRGEYRLSNPVIEMFRPYGRIVLLHVCIVIGGMLVMFAGSPTILVLLFMLGKTAMDVVVHCNEHLIRRATDP